MRSIAKSTRPYDKDDERDLVWAEAHESLADLFWTRRNQMNWGAAWPHYQQALDWWAGQREIDHARDRYLKIVFKAAEPPRPNEYYFYTYYGNYIPLNVLENALKISTSDNDRAHLHFLIAMTMRYTSGDWETRLLKNSRKVKLVTTIRRSNKSSKSSGPASASASRTSSCPIQNFSLL